MSSISFKSTAAVNVNDSYTTVGGPGVVYSSSKDQYSTVNVYSHTSAPSNFPVLIFTKTFKAYPDYYYPVEPFYNIQSNNINRYVIKAFRSYNSFNKLESITFKVSYIFTNENLPPASGDQISFNRQTLKTFVNIKRIKQTKLLGGDIMGDGGLRVAKVIGDPGATFDLTIKNTAGATYDFDINEFTTQPTSIEGSSISNIVPESGVFTAPIEIPSVASTTTYNVDFGGQGETAINPDVANAAQSFTQTPPVRLGFTMTQSGSAFDLPDTATIYTQYFNPDTQFDGDGEAIEINWGDSPQIEYNGANIHTCGEAITAARTNTCVANNGGDFTNTNPDNNGGWQIKFTSIDVGVTSDDAGNFTIDIKFAGYVTKSGTADATITLPITNFLTPS